MTIPHIRNRVLLGVAAGGLAAVLAACGGGGNGSSSGDSSSDNSTGSGSGTQVTAEMTDFHIDLSTQKFQPGEHIFTVHNKGGHTHGLEIEGPGGENRSKDIEPGQSTTLTVNLKSGSYEVYCPVDGHKDLGMKTEITVGGAPAPSTDGNASPGNGY
ncbi:cupredoxin domain-containing protein [Streptomyces sp. bgisy034]|uniref:cupredoxin domain-containing protein n=1 Tax=Streptomyces sp. bgisy034 TaxID=3413774 RepID=UPI003EBB16CD